MMARIGNGLYVRTSAKPSLLDQYRMRKQPTPPEAPMVHRATPEVTIHPATTPEPAIAAETETYQTCEDCGGTGCDPGSLHEPEECPTCCGSGKLLTPEEVARNIQRWKEHKAPDLSESFQYYSAKGWTCG